MMCVCVCVRVVDYVRTGLIELVWEISHARPAESHVRSLQNRMRTSHLMHLTAPMMSLYESR